MKNARLMAFGGALVLGLTGTFAPMAAQAQMTDPAPGAPAMPGGQPPQGGGHRGFAAMDTNHDGVITLDEWIGAGRHEKRFAMIDANHDGKITRDELRTYMQTMRAEHMQNGGGIMPASPPPQAQ